MFMQGILLVVLLIVVTTQAYEYYDYEYYGGYEDGEYDVKKGEYEYHDHEGGYEYGNGYGDGYEYGGHGADGYEYYDYEYGAEGGNSKCDVCQVCQEGYEPVNGICQKLSKQRNDGEYCSTDTSCKSDTCRGGVCCHSNDNKNLIEKCAYGSGDIKKCNEGYVFYDKIDHCAKLLAPGTKCHNDELCSNRCMNYCCESQVANCEACAAKTGKCARCKEGYMLLDGKCKEKLGKGASCSGHNFCKSGMCKSHCCSASQTGSGCLECGDDGECTRCARGSILIGGACIKPQPYGAECESDGMCKSKNCHSETCCKASVSDQCTKCDKLGNCAECSDGLVVYNAVSCVDPRLKVCKQVCGKLWKSKTKCEKNKKEDCDCYYKKTGKKKYCLPDL